MDPLQPILPFDVLNQIVACVPLVPNPGNKTPTPTLAALSTTCHALTAPAQRCLFETIVLITPLGWSTGSKPSSTPEPDTRTIALRDLFRTSPHLTSYGLRVSFIMGEPDDEYMDMSTEVLQCILQNPSARDIFIVSPDVGIPMDWTSLKPGLQEALVGLCHSVHVREIRLRGITRFPMAILEAPALQKVELESVYSFLSPQAGADASGLEGPAEGESTKSEVKVGTIVFHDDDGNGMCALREVLKVASQLHEFEIHSKYIYIMFSTIQTTCLRVYSRPSPMQRK